MESRKLSKKDLKPREFYLDRQGGLDVDGDFIRFDIMVPSEIDIFELESKIKYRNDRLLTVSVLDRIWLDLDGKAVIMGSINFLTARLTGYKFFKDKIKVKENQSLYGRLVELLNILISKLKGTVQ